ncbi:EamA family transporter, partial [Aeromonas sp. HMWF016]
LWLGVGASGLGYFLWNKGATLVSSGVLAIMNNALIPAGLLVNLLIWGKDTDLTRLAIGGVLMLASLKVCQHRKVTSS